jgi:uncharacterized protein
MALFYGGLAQLLAGMWEFVASNTFGATGEFWGNFPTIPSSFKVGWYHGPPDAWIHLTS